MKKFHFDYKYKKIYRSIQYRWKGELANEYNKILNYLLKNYKKNISSNFKVKTNKDKIVKKLLYKL
jgi:hypothetical protein|tara:strand:+ start:758 stop:955 length:198 start_codon:yes stop_codon:yes gene_type:complete